MKQQTAVEFIVEQLNKSIGLTKFVDTCDEYYKLEILGIIEQAKQMEKEQIMEAHYAPKYGCFSEQYYNETFKSE